MGNVYVDGARVLCRAAGRFAVGYDGREITNLVIAHYEDDRPDAIYLFACSAEDDVIVDLLYSSVQDAQLDAARFYQVSTIKWLNAEPSAAPDPAGR